MTSVLPISRVGVEDELIVARSAQIPQKQSVMIFNRRQYPRFEYMECVDTAVVRSACSELYSANVVGDESSVCWRELLKSLLKRSCRMWDQRKRARGTGNLECVDVTCEIGRSYLSWNCG